MAKRDAFMQQDSSGSGWIQTHLSLTWWQSNTQLLCHKSHKALAKLFHFPTDPIPFAEKIIQDFATEGVENEKRKFGIDLTWLERKKLRSRCLLPGQNCKGLCVANECFNFSKILVSKIWQITPPFKLVHNISHGLKTRLQTDLKIQLVGRYNWVGTFLSQRDFCLILFFFSSLCYNHIFKWLKKLQSSN